MPQPFLGFIRQFPSAPVYRADIDGLRAIAVALVMAFHAFPEIFPGGFIGVDVFFVISGFLITSIIVGECSHHSFSFEQFYLRRIRRIFPPLLMILIACAIFGYFALLADEYQELGKHLAAGAGFYENLLSWSQSGYFDNAPWSKPLLHLWSLGVEEQFYVLWPPMLWIFWRWRVSLFPLLLLCLLSSFWLNIHEVYTSPVAAFFSPFTRFWEFLIGALLVYQPYFASIQNQHRPLISTAFIQSAFSALGLFLMAVGLFSINAGRAFPGWWALVPVMGTFLLIASGPHAWSNRHVLAHPVMVKIGKISYSLYLWHWPILSFLRILGYTSVWARIVGLIATVILAALTYYCVERPIRLYQFTLKKALIICSLMALIGVTGAVIYLAQGFPNRAIVQKNGEKAAQFSQPDLAIEHERCPPELESYTPAFKYCRLSQATYPQYAIVGDSHAAQLYFGISQLDSTHSWLLIGHNATPPLSQVQVITPDSEIVNRERQMSYILGYLTSHDSIKTVVLAFYGNTYFEKTAVAADHVALGFSPSQVQMSASNLALQTNLEKFTWGLSNTIKILEQAGKDVIVVLDNPELPFFPRDCLRHKMASSEQEPAKNCMLSYEEVLQRQENLRAMLRTMQTQYPKLRVYDSFPLFCNQADGCQFETADLMLYRDSHHLSLQGSRWFAQYFLSWLEASHSESLGK